MKNIIILLFFISIFSLDALTKKTPSFVPISFTAAYLKTYKARVGKKIIETKGSLDYKYPSNIFLKYEDSNLLKEIVVNNNKVWDYTPPFDQSEKGELKIFKSQKIALLKFLDVLHEGLVDNKMFTVKKLKDFIELNFSGEMLKEYDFLRAEIYPKVKVSDISTMSDVEKVVLHFSKKSKKKPETYSFQKIEEKSFDKKHFVFNPPANTNITNN